MRTYNSRLDVSTTTTFGAAININQAISESHETVLDNIEYDVNQKTGQEPVRYHSGHEVTMDGVEGSVTMPEGALDTARYHDARGHTSPSEE